MESVVEGFYWFTSAVTYQLPNILILYLCTCIVRLHKTQQIKRVALYITVSFMLIFAIVGANETSMTLLLLLLLSILALSTYSNRRINWILVMFVIAAGIASYFVILAPGNHVRMTFFSQRQNLLFSVKSAVVDSFKKMYSWTSPLPVLVLTILFIPFAADMAAKKIKHQNNFFINPIFPFGASIVLLVATFFPTYWSMGESPPGRIINVIYLFFLLGWFVNVYIFTEYFVRKYKMMFARLPKYAVVIMCSFASLSFLKYDSNIRKAYTDLLTGKASRYDKELTKRYKMIAESQSDICEVGELKSFPTTLFTVDITSDAEDWFNKAYARYFHKKAIVLRNSNTISAESKKSHQKTSFR